MTTEALQSELDAFEAMVRRVMVTHRMSEAEARAFVELYRDAPEAADDA